MSGSSQDAVERIAVVRALHGLGDLLCAVPALRALRSAWPAARVTMFGVERGRWLAERRPDLIDDWYTLPSWPGIPETVGSADETLALLASDLPSFDLALQLHGSGRWINGFTRSLGARLTVGHVEPGQQSPRGIFLPWNDRGHEIERLLDVTRAVGATASPRLEFPLHPTDRGRASEVVPHLVTSEFAVIHPGVSRPDRRWTGECFAAVADHLATRRLEIVLTGSNGERDLTRQVRKACRVARPLDVAGRFDLGGLAAVVDAARVVVVNDTGVAHLSVARDTPTLVVGTTSDLDRWGPLDRRRHAAVQTVGRPDADVGSVLTELDRLLVAAEAS